MSAVGWTWWTMVYFSDSKLRVKHNSGKIENASTVLQDRKKKKKAYGEWSKSIPETYIKFCLGNEYWPFLFSTSI